MSARIRPGKFGDVGPFVWAFSRIAGRVQRTEPPAVFLTLGRHRRLFWGWLHFAGRLMPGGRLPRRSSELVIIRVAARMGSEYELVQHRRLGERAGLRPDEIEALATDTGEWDLLDQLLVDVTDELLASDDLSDATWQRVRQHFDDREVVELIMLVEHYRMLAVTLHTLRVVPDRGR